MAAIRQGNHVRMVSGVFGCKDDYHHRYERKDGQEARKMVLKLYGTVGAAIKFAEQFYHQLNFNGGYIRFDGVLSNTAAIKHLV